MTSPEVRYRRTKLWIEYGMAFLIAAALTRAMLHAYTEGYLPQPFFYMPFDVWMDWFNTADWSHDAGTYDTWGTIYPPLSFVFLKAVTLPQCYISGGNAGETAYFSRNCDWLGLAVLHLIYLTNIYLAARIFLKFDRSTALPRAFAFTAGLPMTSAFERGNLLLVTVTCLLLAFGPLLKSARLRWIALGCAINFKLYLVAVLFPQLLRRRWRWFEGALIATAAIYIISFCILGRGTPFEIATNIFSYTDGAAFGILDMWSATTYTAAISLLNGATMSNGTALPITGLIGSDAVEILLIVLPGSVLLVQTVILIAVVGAWLRPEALPMSRITNLGLLLALVTSETGGYTQMLPMIFLFMEKWRGFGMGWALICSYILCIPFDIPTDAAPPVVLNTFFDDGQKLVTYSYMLGPYIRPAIFSSIAFAIACSTIRMVWTDIRLQGWRTRWRFRRDLPIMVGEGSAIPPSRSAVAGGSS